MSIRAVDGGELANKRRSENFGRKSLSAAFVQALRQTRTSRAAAARMLGVTDRTLRRWLRLETPIAVELIADVPRLATAFARCLALSIRRRVRLERNGNGSKRTAPRMARAKKRGA